MKLRELLHQLNITKKIYGDNIEVVMSKDPEGNEYATLDTASLSYVYDKEDDFVNARFKGILPENAQKQINDFVKNTKVIGVCIYPWEEGLDSAEEACNFPKIKEERELNHKIAMAENRMDAAKETGEML